MAEEVHSLKSEILLDFQQAKTNAEEFYWEVENIATAFSTISDAVSKIDLQVGKRLAKAVKDLRGGGELNVNATSIMAKIENALAQAVLTKDIQLTGLEEFKAFTVTPDAKAWNKVRRQVIQRIEQAIAEAEVTAKNLKPITLNTRTLNQMRDRFNRALHEAIDNDLQFEWDERVKLPGKFEVTAEHMAKILHGVREKFLEYLADPANIRIAELPPFEVSSERLNQAIAKIREAIGDIDEKFEMKADALKNIPNVKAKLATLRTDLAEIIKNIVRVVEGIDNLALAKGDAKEFAQLQQAIATLRTTFLKRMEELAKMVTVELVDSHAVGTRDFALARAALDSAQEHIHNYLLKQVNASVQALISALGIERTVVDGKEIYIPSVKEIQNRILEASRQAIENIEKANLQIDTNLVLKAFNEWAKFMSTQMDSKVRAALALVTMESLTAHDKVLKEFANSIAKVVNFKIPDGEALPPAVIEIPIKETSEKVYIELRRLVREMIQNAKFEAKGATEGQQSIEIPSYVLERVNKAIQSMLYKQTQTFVNQVKGHKGVAINDADLQEINAKLYIEAKRLVDIILAQARQITSTFYDGGYAKALKPLSVDEQARLKARFQESFGIIIDDYVGSLENALGAFVLTTATMGKVKDDLTAELNRLVSRAKITFTDEDITFQLRGVIRRVQQKIQQVVKANIEAWQPNVLPFVLDIDVQKLVAPIQKAIKAMMNDVAIGIVEQTNTVSETLKLLGKEDKKPLIDVDSLLQPINDAIVGHIRSYANLVVKAVSGFNTGAVINTRKLHADVRRALAREQDLTVREWLKQNPVLRGEEALRRIMLENLKAITDKFHDAVQRNSNTAITEYKDALAKVDIQPNLEAVSYLARQLNYIQDEIARKVKQVLQAQFKAMTEEIKKLQLYPVSIGYTPPQYVQKAVQQATGGGVAKATSPRTYGAPYGGFDYSGRGFSNRYMPVNYGGFTRRGRTPIDISTRTWMGSVLNTMRYITAGAVMGVPYMLYNTAFESAKEMDYQLEKAEQNFLIKDPTMRSVAQRRVYDVYDGNVPTNVNELVDEEAKRLIYLTQGGAVRAVQDIALANAIDQEEVAKAFHISSRRFDDPNEAIAMTREVAKVRSIEEVDVEEAAKGFEAVASQWGLDGFAMEKVANMMIKAANISQATVEDLLQTQARSGAIFRQNLPDMTKQRGLATSIALSSMFTQSTARTGAEGGTFWKAILQRPYTREGREILENLSQQKGFEQLNPWIVDEQGRKMQKPFTEMFANIMEAGSKMDDASRKALFEVLYPRWHESSAEAIGTFIEDLQKEANKMVEVMKAVNASEGKETPNLTIREALEQYISTIENADERDVALIQAGMMDTWKFRQQRLKTMWEVSTYGVFEELKDEFGATATYLTVFLRLLRENADKVAGVITLLGKIAVAYGVKYGYDFARNKASEWINTRRAQRIGEAYRTNRYYLEEEGRVRNLQRLGLEDQMAHYQRQRDRVAVKRVEIESKLMKPTARIVELDTAIAAVEKDYNDMVAAGASGQELAAKDQERTKLKREKSNLEKGIKPLQNQLVMLERIDKNIEARMQKLGGEMAKVDQQSASLQNRLRMLDLAMEDLGLDTSKVRSSVVQLDTAFRMGSPEKYEAEIRRLATQAGMADNDLKRLRIEVDRLTQAWSRGEIEAEEYIRQIKKLERAHLTGAVGIAGGGLGKNPGKQEGLGLMDMVVAGSLFSSSMITSDKTKGVLGKFTSFWRNKSPKTFGGALLALRKGKNLLRGVKNLSGVSKVLGTAGKIGGFLRGVPSLGQAMLAMDIAEVVLNPLMAATMTEGEKMELRASSAKDLARRVQDIDDKAWYNPMKYIGSAFFVKDALLDGIKRLFGGTSAGFGEYGKAILAGFTKEGKDLEETLKKELDYENLAAEAKIKLRQEDLARIDAWDADGDGLIDKTIDKNSMALPVEQVDEYLNYFNKKLEEAMKGREYEFQITRTKMLLQGLAEDSQAVRDLMSKYLQENIKILDKAIKDVQERRDVLVEGSEGWQALDVRLKELQLQREQMQYEQFQNEYSKVEEIMRLMDRDVALKQAEYDIKRSEEVIQGVPEDSPVLKKLEEARAKDINLRIEQAQAQLREMLKGYKKSDEQYKQIWLQIMQLEADQKKMLADIRKQLEKNMSTFNLPAGMKPLTYWEATTKNATHKNVTVRSGDVTVNVTIDKMSGDTKDIEKVTTAISKAIKDTQVGLVERFARDVKSGMGSLYYNR